MFNQYPYINLNDLNLDYILKAIKEMRYEVTNFVSINAIKYADPIQWDITSQYEKNTIVIDPQTGTAYISVAPVPAGVALTRPEYWTVVFDLQSFVTKANQNLANNYEEQTTTTATMNTAKDAWVIWGDVLYKALVNITAGDAYVVGSNIQHITIEDIINAILQDIADEVQARQDAIDAEMQARQDADDALQDAIDDEEQARQNADDALQDAIDAEMQARQNAINGVNNTIGNLNDLDTTDKSSVVAAINESLLSGSVYYDISKHGAVADGATDNTAIIQAGIDSGMPVFIPRGVWGTRQLELKYATKIVGVSDGYANNGSVLKALDSTGSVLHIATGMQKCTVEDISILGDRATSTQVHGIKIEHNASDYYLHRVYIDHCQIGIYAGSTGWATIESCFVESCYNDAFRFENSADDTNARPLQINLINCLAEKCNGTGYKFLNRQNAVAPAGTMLNCATFKCGERGVIYYGGFSAVRMTNCFFGNDAIHELYFYGNQSDFTATITNCQFELCGTSTTGINNEQAATHSGVGVAVAGSGNITLDNCLISGNSANGLIVAGSKAAILGVNFLNNGVYDSDNRAHIKLSSAIIQIDNCRFNSAYNGIDILSPNDVVILTNNMFERYNVAINQAASTAKVYKSNNLDSDYLPIA